MFGCQNVYVKNTEGRGLGQRVQAFRSGAVADHVPHCVTLSKEGNFAMSSSSHLLWAGRKVRLVMWCGAAWGSPLWDVTWDGWLLRWYVMGLTVVKSERVIQAAQLLQSGMHHSCSVTGNRQCLRFSIMNYGSQPLLVPATWVKWDRSKS